MRANKTLLSTALAVLLLTSPAPASDQGILSRPGVRGIPYVGADGTPDLAYSDDRGHLFLSTRAQDSGLGPGLLRAARSDEHGRLWLVWDSPRPAGDQVFLGRKRTSGVPVTFRLSDGLIGSHHSPHMDLGAGGRPWTVWVNDRAGRHILLAGHGSQGRVTIVLRSESPVYAPRIVVDILNRPWVFWVGRGPRHDAVFCSHREGGRWTAPRRLSRRPAVPNFHPSPALNEWGFPAVAWSAFDGRDYELFFSSWQHGGWTPPERITRNRDLADAEPTLVYHQGTIPVLAWTQAGPQGPCVMLTHRQHTTWERPIRLTATHSAGRSPMLVSQGTTLALGWRDGDRICVRALNLAHPPRFFDPLQPAPPLSTRSAELEDSTFIAFGDSITFGAMNGPYQGTGYPPRLEALLRDLFPDPAVINRGVPGEATWEAVSRIHHVLATDLALYLLLKEGTNDVSSLSYSLDTTAFNLEHILNAALDRGMFPLISTIIPRAGSRWTATAKQRTIALNAKIVDLAEKRVLMLADTYTAFINFPPESGGHEALISGDELHPNNLGYQVMAETWFTKIKAIPYPPTEIQAEKSERTQSVLLTWAQDPKIIPETGLQQIRIYRKRLPSGALVPMALVPASRTDYEDSIANLERDYLYLLSSLNGFGIEGPLSDPVKAVRIEPFAPLQIRSRVEVNYSFLAREYINIISWQENPENLDRFTISGYRIYRKTQGQPDENFVFLGQVASDSLTYWDRGLTSEDEADSFVYGISAVDSLGRESPIGKS
jgi:lysophospholipase L1-like esterase